jgi:UPF0755 protein
MKRKKRNKTKVLTGIVLLLAYFTMGWFLLYIDRPVNPALPAKTVRILPGTGLFKVVDKLQREGLVRNPPFFYLLVLTKGAARHLRAGAYEFSGKMTPLAIVNKLSRGDISVCKVTIAEDLSLKEIAAQLAERHLVDGKKFLALATDRTFLRSLGIEGSSAEGYLYPDTYFFDFAISPEQLIRRMVEQFWRVVNPEMRNEVHQMGLTMNEFVTVASLIGKETGYSAEKPLIAAVFYNRLKKGMRLQSDPTAVYHMTPFEGKITRRHLLTPSPHNTYCIKGLPPGPIANPGRDSLLAAVHPAKVEYLYFVSKGNGSHQFSSTLKEHNQAVVRYRLAKEKDV